MPGPDIGVLRGGVEVIFEGGRRFSSEDRGKLTGVYFCLVKVSDRGYERVY